MAVSQIEEKILGRLAKETAPSNPLLSASLYQVLGLSILLSRKLYRARRVRKLDISRDTKSLQLYHQIIWLAREGLSITEVYVLPYCQNGEQGPECRVMAAKLRASLYHIFSLFHNHPPIQQLSPASGKSSSSNGDSPKAHAAEERQTPSKSPRHGKEERRRRRRTSKTALRDPIPSMTSDASYITNPYATAGAATTPSPRKSGSPSAKQTPSRPPGLKPIDVAPAQAAASFLLPPLNFVPMAKEYFETAQQLSDTLLSAASGLRLSISLEHSAFMWDCEKKHDEARRLARQAIRDVYASTDGLDDDEFADASALVQALGGIVRRGSQSPIARQNDGTTSAVPPDQADQANHATRNVSDARPANVNATRTRIPSPAQQRSFTRTPERLSTVQEDPSQETSETAPTTLSPPPSRTSNRSRGKLRRPPSANTIEEKAAKRRAIEQAEEIYRRNSARSRAGSAASASNTEKAVVDDADAGSRAHSRQNTPPDGAPGASRAFAIRNKTDAGQALARLEAVMKQDEPRLQALDQRRAVLAALSVVSSVHQRLSQSSRLRHSVGIAR